MGIIKTYQDAGMCCPDSEPPAHLASHMEYLVNELLKGNKPQDLKRHYAAKRYASNLESRKEI